MLVLSQDGEEINIGDNVILWDGYGCYKAKLIRETRFSVAYNIYDFNNSNNTLIDFTYWIRKRSKPFISMYKI